MVPNPSLFLLIYLLYVDDIIILTDNKNFIRKIKKIRKYLLKYRKLKINTNKIYFQHYLKGVKFIGCVLKPGRAYCSNRTYSNFYNKLNYNMSYLSYQSYIGLFKHYLYYNFLKKLIKKKLKC